MEKNEEQVGGDDQINNNTPFSPGNRNKKKKKSRNGSSSEDNNHGREQVNNSSRNGDMLAVGGDPSAAALSRYNDEDYHHEDYSDYNEANEDDLNLSYNHHGSEEESSTHEAPSPLPQQQITTLERYAAPSNSKMWKVTRTLPVFFVLSLVAFISSVYMIFHIIPLIQVKSTELPSLTTSNSSLMEVVSLPASSPSRNKLSSYISPSPPTVSAMVVRSLLKKSLSPSFLLSSSKLLTLQASSLESYPAIFFETDEERRSAHIRGIIEAIIFSLVLFLFLLSFFLAIFVPPGYLHDLKPSQAFLLDNVAHKNEMKKGGGLRVCKWCVVEKPDRCHHCRVCRSCVLKMDHHCPWIDNCVGYNNHKYFILSVLYSVILTLFVAATSFESLKYAIDTPTVRFYHLFLLLFMETLNAFLCVVVFGFFTFHMYLLSRGMTTIEFCEKQFRWRTQRQHGDLWNRGSWQNFKDVFGSNPLLWFIPLDNRDGNGIIFEAASGSASSAVRDLENGPRYHRVSVK